MKRGATVDFEKLPAHVAVIMDGNGRWAAKRFLTRNAGHKAGAESLRKLAEKMNGQGFRYLTVYAFSTENWTRPEDEVRGLMTLLGDYIQQYIDDSKKNNMRIHVIGDTAKLEPALRDKIEYLKELTRNHDGLFVTIAINYGGRDEIIRAVRRLHTDIVNGAVEWDSVSPEFFSAYLDTKQLPDPDLIIRTGGEMRLSNFMLWQAAYAEFYACPKLWPDFTYQDLLAAVCDYQSRDRRFGGL